jgi:hypothetical protein
MWMFNETRIMISQCLLGVVEAIVTCRHLRKRLKQVVDQCVDLVGQEYAQLLSNHLDAKRVDRANDGRMAVLESLQPFENVVAELAGGDSVESDHEHVMAVDGKAIRTQYALDTSY